MSSIERSAVLAGLQSTARVKIISLFCESLVYGVFSALYAISMWVLVWKVNRRPHGLSMRNKVLAFMTTMLFLMSTVHLGVELKRIVKGFVYEGANGPPGAVAYLLNLRDPDVLVQDLLYTTMIVIGDGFMTYRLYIVWAGDRLVIALPVLVSVATTVVGYITCAVQARSDLADPGVLRYWLIATYSLTLAGNILATTLIAVKILWTSYQLHRARAVVYGTSLWAIVDAIFQSALIYSASVVCQLAAFLTGSNGWFVVLEVSPPLIGVVFTLIIIRVGLRTTTTTDELYTMKASYNGSMGSMVFKSQSSAHPLRPLEVNVSVARTAFTDGASKAGSVSSDFATA